MLDFTSVRNDFDLEIPTEGCAKFDAGIDLGFFQVGKRLDFGHTLGKRYGLQLKKSTLGRGDFRTILENSSMSFFRNTFVATPQLLGT